MPYAIADNRLPRVNYKKAFFYIYVWGFSILHDCKNALLSYHRDFYYSLLH